MLLAQLYPSVGENQQADRFAHDPAKLGTPADAALGSSVRNLTWSRSGELFFTSRRGTVMAYRPGATAARLLGVRLGAPLLDIAAN